MDDVLARLKKAIAEGAALATLGLAGCTAPVVPGLDSGTSSTLPAWANECHGHFYDSGFGYHGQCCNRIDPAPCDATQPANLPPGSGGCGCRIAEDGGDEAWAGPYAAADGGAECAFVVGWITCDGRPLLVDGEPLTAPVVSRSDWA
jgi:hypothetical protein